jgi:hypothetical protein
MENWKTTLTGLVTGAALLASHYGVVIPASVQTEVVVLGILLLGWLASDKKTEE